MSHIVFYFLHSTSVLLLYSVLILYRRSLDTFYYTDFYHLWMQYWLFLMQQNYKISHTYHNTTISEIPDLFQINTLRHCLQCIFIGNFAWADLIFLSPNRNDHFQNLIKDDDKCRMMEIIGNQWKLTRKRYSNCLTHSGRDKWTSFCRRHFQLHFPEWKCLNSD